MQEMLNTLARRSFAACRVRNLIAVLAIDVYKRQERQL